MCICDCSEFQVSSFQFPVSSFQFPVSESAFSKKDDRKCC
ncbi:Uncharacterized protein dnm_060710 [Desulfonema magnum]|uniref:Uncharacterized protein n=1 Tax=Desulfonema magnum TaxID=45655 RepID=A0A975GQG2_9BACT|nr:Uncharacterized protein dnm_060710 [Desulfonema magnum]